jgi:hypothetical protein
MRAPYRVAAAALAVAFVAPRPARADDDAWTQTIKKGAAQEHVERYGETEEEREANERRYLRTIFFVDADLGYLGLHDYGGPGIAIGGGLRHGLGDIWTFRARISIGFSSGSVSFGETSTYNPSTGQYTYTDSNPSIRIFLPSIEATFRARFSPTSPLFFGFGPRVGAVLPSDGASGSVLPALELEFGGSFGPEEKFEAGVRGYIGGTNEELKGNSELKPAGWVGAFFGYSIN